MNYVDQLSGQLVHEISVGQNLPIRSIVEFIHYADSHVADHGVEGVIYDDRDGELL